MAFAIDADQKALRDRVDFAILAAPAFDPGLGTRPRDAELDARLVELTAYFTVFAFIVPLPDIVLVASIEAALASGEKDYCLIQSAGHLLFGHKPLAVDLLAALPDCQFLMGRVIDRGGYFYLDDQCLLVDRRAWRRLGRPSFGLPHAGTQTVAAPTYTPPAPGRAADLEPGAGTLKIEGRFGPGWHAISASLAAGVPVRNWPASVARWQIPCRAYYGDLAAWRGTLLDRELAAPPGDEPDLRSYVAQIMQRLLPNTQNPPVFVFNSEADMDLPVVGAQAGVDAAFVLAAGFKANRILESTGFHAGTHVVFYDYSAAALELKRLMVREWDGVDFGAFFMAVRPRLEAAFPDRLWYMQPEALATEGTLNHEFQAEMRGVFADFNQWIAHWRRFRALSHSFVQIDVIAAPERAAAMIAEHTRGFAVLWLSDMFNAPYAVAKFSLARRREAYARATETLAAHSEACLVLGGAPASWMP